MFFDELIAETERQLNVCNSCRYCEGYCPVWPAMELRTELTKGDITHLANLCHDCRDSFSACMYTAPHEFNINPPAVFTQVREHTYAKYVWPRRSPGVMRGRRGIAVAYAAIVALLVLLSVLTNATAFESTTTGSAYDLLRHQLLIAVVMVPALWSIGLMSLALVRYWRDTHGPVRDLFNGPAWATTLNQSARMTHQSGAGEGCTYEENEPSASRRHTHQLVMYGFMLTFVATFAAAIEENILGLQPPYPYLSVPVITGSVGGIMAVIGCVALIRLKKRSDPLQTTATMRQADYGLLWALLILMISGLLVLLTRLTMAFGPFLVVHLAAVIIAFGIMPYTKFVHWTYRILAIYKDNFERAQARLKVTA